MRINDNTKLILDSISAPIVIIDNKKSIVYVNHSYELMINQSKKELIGEKISDVRPDSRIGEVIDSGVPLCSIKRQSLNNNFFSDIYPIFKDGNIIGAISTSFEQNVIQNLLKTIDSNEKQIKTLQQKIFSANYTFEHIIGESFEIKSAISKAKKFSNKTFPIFIQGESGTGKELFAQSIHNYSTRKNAPFIAVNCATLETNLLESELFGYVKGVFTDAHQDGKKGLFEEANGGTIFLDEITETSVSTQSKLLRVIQEKTIRPVGSNYEIPIDVRIICSTNKNVHTLINQKSFKKDLFFRINTFSIEVPPLRKRDDDTLILAAHFLNESYFHFDDKYVDFLSTYEWPGNVRELKNVIEFSKAMATDDLLTIELLPEYLKNYATNKLQTTDMSLPSNEIPTLKEFTANMEKNYILSLLQKQSNDKAGKEAVAKLLNISLASLYNKIR